MEETELIVELYKIGILKFGNFTLKSGHTSPFYLDLRSVISFPPLLKQIVERINLLAQELTYDLVCGVPYTALPFATAHSLQFDVPMLIRRKEVKGYGTKKIIEGVYKPGQTCLIIEDLVTTGTSVLETIAPMNQLGIGVNEVIVVIDREQGGVAKLCKSGYHTQALFTLSQILTTLEKQGCLTKEETTLVRGHCHDHQLI